MHRPQWLRLPAARPCGHKLTMGSTEIVLVESALKETVSQILQGWSTSLEVSGSCYPYAARPVF